jgi:transposase
VTTDGTQVLDAPTLPGDIDACHALIQLQHAKEEQLAEQLANATRKISQMEHQLQQLLRRLYGRSSEKIDPRQMALFAELLKQLEAQNPPVSEPPVAPAAPSTDRKGHGRRRLPADLPRERVIHDLPEEEKPCPCCGTPRTLIGEETSEQLDYVPAQVKVIEHVRLKYICKECEKNVAEGGSHIVTAEKPLSPIEKSLAAPGLIAHLIVSRFADHLPYYRLERILRRHGIELARSTQSDIAAQAAQALLPLHKLAIEDLLASRIIHTDDTPVDVLEPRSGKTREGRFWVYLGDAAHPQVVFDYTPNRKRDGPMNFLKDWGKDALRYLQADAFGGYDGIFAGEAGGQVVEVACWAHARRYFYDARKTDHRNSAAALAYIKLLYDVENDAANVQPRERAELRQGRSAPILVQFRTWLLGLQAVNGGSVLPKSPMGEAITYALNQWAALCVYLLDGELNIDNNTSENALRRIAIGRKNWLFCGSDNGGRTAAILFSFIAACQRHDVEPFAYLRDVLTRIASHPLSRLAELLPGNWKPPG